MPNAQPSTIAAASAAYQFCGIASTRDAAPEMIPDQIDEDLALPDPIAPVAEDGGGRDHRDRVERRQHQHAFGRLVLGDAEPVDDVEEQVERRHVVAEVDQEPGDPGPREVGVLARRDPERPQEAAPTRTAAAGDRPGARGRASRVRRGSSGPAARPWSRGSPAAMLPVRLAMATPPTMPTVWAIATSPPIRPRRSTGTWSGMAAMTAAYMALRNTWTPHQADQHRRHRRGRRERDQRHRAARGADQDPRQPPPHPPGGAVGEGAEDRVADRRDGRADAEHQRQHRLLLAGRDLTGLLGEQHLDRAEPARHDAEVDQRQRDHPARRRCQRRLGQRRRSRGGGGHRLSVGDAAPNSALDAQV